jgi:hypothetical protein
MHNHYRIFTWVLLRTGKTWPSVKIWEKIIYVGRYDITPLNMTINMFSEIFWIREDIEGLVRERRKKKRLKEEEEYEESGRE